MLIGDSPSCPHCGHVLDAARASSEFLDLIPSGELALSEGDDEAPCKQCGEMVRVGLVRCWHCGAFTNPDIEATYQRMQASPTPIMYSDVSNAEADRAPEHAPSYSSQEEDDGGFELDDSYGLKTSVDEGFKVAAEGRKVSPSPVPAPAADSDYELAVAHDDDFSVDTQATATYPVTIPTGDVAHQEYDQAAYDQAVADQAAYDQQYQTPWGYKLSADGTAYEIDYEAWQAAGYDPNAAPGEPGYYDPYAGQSTDQQEYATESPAVAEAAADVQPATATPAPAKTRPSAGAELPAPPEVAHSVSTGGDALLAAAIEEEKDYAKIRKAGGRKRANVDAPPPGSFVVYCPNGHRVQVFERHRGRAGRCPSCKAVFFVPLILGAPEGAAATPEVPTGPQRFEAGDYTDWMFELRLHTVSPLKLKLKPGAMAAEYDVADIAFSEQDMLVAMVFKRAGTFAAMQEKKKKPATRIAVADFLQTKKPVSGLPVPFQTLVTASDASQLKIVQPAIPGEESIFAGIPVFGPGRIVVRLPAALDGGSRAYLSFSLSEFREFARLLEKVFGIVNFGQELGIPLTDSISTYKCHYSENELATLDNADFYLPDPALKPVILGYQCAGCGLTVSEDSRKKEKIGGKNEASIAKATCPKCKKKFGHIPLYGLDPNAKPNVFGMLPAEK
ncbi:MAG: hypothetical protein JWN70_1705 [Planctomycetaceae bacterium]|nr:hypothetical protein [Planctomycetaceae bacterium]